MPSPRSEVTVRRIDMADELAAPLANRLVLMGATIQEHLDDRLRMAARVGDAVS